MTLSGIKYPLEFNSSGGIKMSLDSEVRQDNIRSLLDTISGERLMRGSYGLPLLLFETINNLSLFDARIQQIIRANIPDINAKVSSTLDNIGQLLIIVEWSYKLEPNTVNTLSHSLNI